MKLRRAVIFSDDCTPEQPYGTKVQFLCTEEWAEAEFLSDNHPVEDLELLPCGWVRVRMWCEVPDCEECDPYEEIYPPSRVLFAETYEPSV